VQTIKAWLKTENPNSTIKEAIFIKEVVVKMKRRKVLCLLVVLTLAFTMSVPVFALDNSASKYGDDVLYEVMSDLMSYGVRIDGSENTKRAAYFLGEEFSKYGSYDVEVVAVPLGYRQTSLYRNYTSVFSAVDIEGAPQLYGRAYPANDTFNNPGNFKGTFHDFGSHTNFTVPDVTSGDIYGTVTFDVAPTAALITTFVNAVKARYTDNVNVTGLYIARTGGTYSANAGNAFCYPPSVTGTVPVPVASLDLASLETARIAGAAGDINSTNRVTISRFGEDVLYSTYATKPAPNGDPDLVIIFSAHLDTVLGATGANDNGSGVVALVELARRFNDVDLGNVELIFAAVNGEETTNMEGSCYIGARLVDEGKAPLTLNFNMDMIAPALNARTNAGAALTTVSLATRSGTQSVGSNWNSQFNIATYFAMADAWNVDSRPSVITNVVTANSSGASDYQIFHHLGMEALSLEHGLEYGYHSSIDNINDNYSHERHLFSVDLMTAAVEKIVASEFSKKAKFYFNEDEGTVSLHNADQLFNTFTSVSTAFTGSFGNQAVTFTPDSTTFELSDDYIASSATGYVNGTSNYLTGATQTFTGRLLPTVVTLDGVVPSAVVEKLSGNTNNLTVTVTEIYSDGSKRFVSDTFSIRNNAAGNYEVGKYKVYVDTKGNDQIRDCRIL